MCNFYSWLLILFFLFIAGVLLNAPFFSQFISSHQQQRHLLRAWKIEINWTSSSLRRSFMCFTSKTKLQLTYVQRGRSFELCMCVTWSSLWRFKDNSCLLFFKFWRLLWTEWLRTCTYSYNVTCILCPVYFIGTHYVLHYCTFSFAFIFIFFFYFVVNCFSFLQIWIFSHFFFLPCMNWFYYSFIHHLFCHF